MINIPQAYGNMVTNSVIFPFDIYEMPKVQKQHVKIILDYSSNYLQTYLDQDTFTVTDVQENVSRRK